jgi:hypothetical protein
VLSFIPVEKQQAIEAKIEAWQNMVS